MDVQMPEMDGLEATRRIRRLEAQQPSLRWPQIYAMTADAMPEDREVCMSAGMNDYLTKPLDFEAVRATLVRTAALIEKRAHAAGEAGAITEPNRDEAEGPEESKPDVQKADAVLVDWSRLDEIREYDTPVGAVMKGIVSSFMQDAPSELLRVRSAASARDGHGLRSSAHALKGAALNVGAVAIAECAAKLETAAKVSAYDHIDLLVDELSRTFAPTMDELNQSDLFRDSSSP
jgi:HPt (histidine-containing phosphotransfer) domain-containing protein